MNSTQGRDTIFTNVNLRTIIPPKHVLKKSQESIQVQLGFVPKTIKGKEIFNDGGKKKYEQTKSIDFSKNKMDDFTVQKKAVGTYNTEYLRRQLETNPSIQQQPVRNQDNQKIKTFFNDPSIKLNGINKDFQIKAEGASDSKVNSRPNYYLSSKNIQRTLNQENNMSQTSKLNNRSNNLSMTSSNISGLDQYRSIPKYENIASNHANQYNKTISHQRCNTDTGIFNQSIKIAHKNIHINKIGVSSTGAGFYMN